MNIIIKQFSFGHTTVCRKISLTDYSIFKYHANNKTNDYNKNITDFY